MRYRPSSTVGREAASGSRCDRSSSQGAVAGRARAGSRALRPTWETREPAVRCDASSLEDGAPAVALAPYYRRRSSARLPLDEQLQRLELVPLEPVEVADACSSRPPRRTRSCSGDAPWAPPHCGQPGQRLPWRPRARRPRAPQSVAAGGEQVGETLLVGREADLAPREHLADLPGVTSRPPQPAQTRRSHALVVRRVTGRRRTRAGHRDGGPALGRPEAGADTRRERLTPPRAGRRPGRGAPRAPARRRPRAGRRRPVLALGEVLAGHARPARSNSPGDVAASASSASMRSPIGGCVLVQPPARPPAVRGRGCTAARDPPGCSPRRRDAG